MFSSIFTARFIALDQSEARIMGHWVGIHDWFDMGQIGIRNMVLSACLYTIVSITIRAIPLNLTVNGFL